MSRICFPIGVCLLGGLFCSAAPARAQSDIAVHGSLRAAYFSSSRDLDGLDDIGTGALWLKAKGRLAPEVSLTAEGYVQRSSPDSTRQGSGELREAYVDVGAGQFDFRIGKQIIAWGRADKLNPTDNLTPRDFTRLVTDTEDQRSGTAAVQMRYMPSGSELMLAVVYIPKIRPNITPLERIPGLAFRETIPGKGQIAVKLDRSGGEVDWSVSYLDGVNLNPDLALASVSASGAVVELRHAPVRVLGADAATVVGRYGLRAEAAYTWTRDAPAAQAYSTRPFFYGVVGADRTFDNGVNVNLQFFLYRVAGFADPRLSTADPVVRSIAVLGAVASQQSEARRRGASIRFSQRMLNDRLEAEVLGVGAFGTRDHGLRTSLAYAVNDQLKLILGGERFRGRPDTFFGRLRDASAAFAEARFNF